MIKNPPRRSNRRTNKSDITLWLTRPRVIHHKHSGRRIPLRYTSYAFVFFLLALTGAVLLFISQAVRADQQQIQGSLNLSGVIKNSSNIASPIIVEPPNNSHPSSNLVDVKGVCEENLVVEIYRNDAFSGSGACSVDGSFDIKLTLISGTNQLKARQGDSAGDYSSFSQTTTIFYDIPKSLKPQPTKPLNRPLLIYTIPVQWGIFPNKEVTLNYEINGGNPPYALTIDWQDGSLNDVHSHDKEGNFSVGHMYKQPGQYSVTVQASDVTGNKALIQTTIIVNGKGSNAASGNICAQPVHQTTVECFMPNRLIHILDVVWPALIIALLMAMSFWIGERVVLDHPPKRLQRAHH